MKLVIQKGNTGAQGATGADGGAAQGTTGLQGGIGAQGFGGSQGASGENGAQGGVGAQGTEGQIGYGLQGSTGVQGTTGSGAQGVQGTTGIQGTDGLQGITGAGVQGVQGTQGIQGDLGVQGTTGAGTQGVQGTDGVGTQGVQGVQGLNGLFAAQGIQGLEGSQGITGTAGDAGAQGVQGDAYIGYTYYTTTTDTIIIPSTLENWVINVAANSATTGFLVGQRCRVVAVDDAERFVAGDIFAIDDTANTMSLGVDTWHPLGGTYNNWTVHLTGSTGEVGSQGTTGVQGTTGAGTDGAQGVQGTTGIQGDLGIQGVQGLTGTGTQGVQGADGGGASVAGANTQIQFNDDGVSGATANLTFDKATNTLRANIHLAANGVNTAPSIAFNERANAGFYLLDANSVGLGIRGDSAYMFRAGTGTNQERMGFWIGDDTANSGIEVYGNDGTYRTFQNDCNYLEVRTTSPNGTLYSSLVVNHDTNATGTWYIEGGSAPEIYNWTGSAYRNPTAYGTWTFANNVTITGNTTLGTDASITFDEHSSAPATPAAGKVVMYAKLDGKMYAKDDAGTESAVGVQGATGIQGTTGVQGITGAGTQGATGAQGATFSGTYSGDVTYAANVTYTSNTFDTPIVVVGTSGTYADNAAGKILAVDSGSAVTVTLAAASVAGFSITILRKGLGNVTIANTTGAARLNTSSFTTANINNRYEAATALYTATNEFVLIGSVL